MFMTPGALEVVLRFASLAASFGGDPATPPMAESTFARSEVSADMVPVVDRGRWVVSKAGACGLEISTGGSHRVSRTRLWKRLTASQWRECGIDWRMQRGFGVWYVMDW